MQGQSQKTINHDISLDDNDLWYLSLTLSMVNWLWTMLLINKSLKNFAFVIYWPPCAQQ